MGYACVPCGREHEWGNEPDGYHHVAFDAQGRVGKFDPEGHLEEEAEECIVKGDLKVAFMNIGEGWSGDYDPSDPEDNNLLRVYISLRGGEAGYPEWDEVEDGSICTSLPVETAPETRRRILEIVFAQAEVAVSREEKRISRHVMDELSYVNPEWPEKGALHHLPDSGPTGGTMAEGSAPLES
jgi:hypothetical protein